MLGAHPVFSRMLIFAPLAIAGASASALAATPAFSLRWEAPPQCPDQAYVRSSIAQLLAGEVPSTSHLEARAHVERCAGDSWCVRLTTVHDGETAERVVKSSSCRSLADATALILGVIIDPESGPEPASGAVELDAPTAPAAEAPPLLPPALISTAMAVAPSKDAPSASPTRSRSQVGIFAQVTSDVGTIPQLAYGFTAGIALMLPELRFEGYAARWTGQIGNPASTPPRSTDVQLIVGGLRGCFVPWQGTLEFSGCSGLELGRLQGQVALGGSVTTPAVNGQGVGATPFLITRSESASFWSSVTTSLHAFWKLTPSFGLALDVGLAFPLRRDAFALGEPGLAAGPAWVTGRASIGPEARF